MPIDDPNPEAQIRKDLPEGSKPSWLKPGSDTAERNVDQDSGDRFKQNSPGDGEEAQIKR